MELLSNSAGSGGAINLGGWGDQTGALNDCTVSGNTADSGAAFSLNNRGRADLIVDGGSVSNVAARADGGVSVDSDATVVVTSSDWGTGATDNLPDDVQGLTFSAGASFQCAGGICW